MALQLNLPAQKQRQTLAEKEVFMITNGDLRDTANKNCWEVQSSYEEKLSVALKGKFGYTMRRAHPGKRRSGSWLYQQPA